MAETGITACDYTNKAHRQAVADMINAYIEDEMGGGEILSKDRQLRLLDGLQGCSGAIVLLAEHANVYCGLLTAFEHFSTFTVQPMINIHDVIVLKAYRGKGIGRQLMNAVIAEAEKRLCSRLTLEVRQDNLVAQHLYRELGFHDTDPPMFYWRKYL
ncbi:MAG: GNAT family N-acetyltransferase [Tannerella sp.]|jgi:ribosomal protein S18 acetylase RimI-like enzyme|nr:GNAT family N-acetyltransferase [Tannerella sp.]